MKYPGPKTGTGRPRKWNEPTIHISMRIPYSILLKIDEMTRPGISRTDVIVALVEAASNADVARHILREKELEEENEALRKENDELKALVDRLNQELEKWRFRAESCEKNKPKLSSKWSKILAAIPQAVEEGLTWNDLMRDLGILDPREQVEVMQRFFITIDDEGRIPEIIHPIKGIEELKGIVLYRQNGGNIRFAKIVREDTLKAAQSLVIETPKPAAEGQPAVEVARVKVEEVLRKWVRDYEKYSLNRHSKTSPEEFIQSIARNGLRRLVREYGFDVVAEVVGSDPDFRVLFGPFLLKLSEKRLEVKARV